MSREIFIQILKSESNHLETGNYAHLDLLPDLKKIAESSIDGIDPQLSDECLYHASRCDV